MSSPARLSQAIGRWPHVLRSSSAARTRPCLHPPQRTTCQTTYLLRRNISTNTPQRAAVATSLPTQPTIVLITPSQADIEKEELDVELIPPEKVKLEITDRAAEQLMKIAEREKNPDAALRVSVESGGCHGYQYKMKLETSRSADDYQFSHPSIKPSNILVDAVSLSLLNGSTIDFATELIGSSFQVHNNPQSKGSGCGCGVSWELKE
ncbi:hypothetical protein BDN70DRAFT_892709 [Pholiota conissans]|uniref:Core domain-containing protein n=1 Tax=Pholiota conissans TaxID=109636 RepID=A0A9P5Z7T0_9AGAR|nr:hypothetical protein BDN70DRAFT_892709 [Pholiota conissans]